VRNHKTEKNGVVYKNQGIAARGQLHKETVFGQRKAPHSEQAFHVRKPIDSLTTEKQINKVVDEKIRNLIFKRIDQLGGFQKEKVPANTFFVVDEKGVKQPQIFLPNKNGEPVPILKVRMKENFSGAEKLKDNVNQFVNPRNNHHVLIYKDAEGNLKEDVVTFWTVVERKRNGASAYQLPPDGKEIVTTMHINDMFLLGLQEDEIDWENLDSAHLKSHLFKIQTLSEMYYEFRLSPNATQVKDTNFDFFRRIQSFGTGKTGWQTFNPIKVKISVSGKIEKL
jgi:CRISPR-associated endonuclease Csn1